MLADDPKSVHSSIYRQITRMFSSNTLVVLEDSGRLSEHFETLEAKVDLMTLGEKAVVVRNLRNRTAWDCIATARCVIPAWHGMRMRSTTWLRGRSLARRPKPRHPHCIARALVSLLFPQLGRVR